MRAYVNSSSFGGGASSSVTAGSSDTIPIRKIMRPIKCRFIESPSAVAAVYNRRRCLTFASSAVIDRRYSFRAYNDSAQLGTNIGRPALGRFPGRHHLSENQLAPFRPNRRQLRAENGGPAHTHHATDRDR